MKIIGIIVEYNPFHLGHINHINEIKKQHGEDVVVVAVMSGNIVQRGEFSITSKFNRTKTALNNGVDLIVQLPTYYSLNSVDKFAQGSVETLNLFNVEHIIFGSETNNIDLLNKISTKMSSDSFTQSLQREIKKIHSFPLAFQNIVGKEFESNDILGINYIYWTKKINPNISVSSIKRNNSEYKSSSEIRKIIRSGQSALDYMPSDVGEVINMNNFIQNFTFWIQTNKLDDDIYKYMKNSLDTSVKTWDELLSSLSNKTYTKARIARELLKGVLDVGGVDDYTPRVLGTTDKGRQVLKKVEKKYNSKFVESYQQDLNISKLLDLVLKTNNADREIKTSTIIKKDTV